MQIPQMTKTVVLVDSKGNEALVNETDCVDWFKGGWKLKASTPAGKAPLASGEKSGKSEGSDGEKA